jgi:hypothetical protein
MRKHRIKFILVQINEAHSTSWPIGLDHMPAPQANIDERVERANEFVRNNHPPSGVFHVCIDAWQNAFDNMFQAWPDKYYCIDKNKKVIAKAEYGDAVILEECTDLIVRIIKKKI